MRREPEDFPPLLYRSNERPNRRATLGSDMVTSNRNAQPILALLRH